MTNAIKVWNLGRVLYQDSDRLQKFLCKLHHLQNPRLTHDSKLLSKKSLLQFDEYNTLLVMEHEPVYTTGLRDYLSRDDEIKLKNLGAQYYKVDRGGLVTFHGPGQLTAYPIINLRHFRPSVKWFVCRLEQSIIETCKKMGVTSERSPHTGVWVGDNKICALGIHVSHGITTHGLALNCSTDLEWFNHIVPCGIEGKSVTSLSKELNRDVSIEEILPKFIESFGEVFECKLNDISAREKALIVENL